VEAQKVGTEMAKIDGLADDLDGTPQWVRPVSTHRFMLDGEEREIDLHDENAAQMHADFAKWINASRKIGRTESSGAAVHHTPVSPRQVAVTKVSRTKSKKGHRDPAQILAEKQWLRSQGHTVSKFGKTPDELQALYQDHLRSLKSNGGYAGSPSEADRLFLAAAAAG
jgi:hypothetical protein